MADQGAPSLLGRPLVERDDALTALRTWADEAATGLGRLVMVSGEAGVGKSTLVEAFRRTVSPAQWLQGACDSLFTPQPLGPLRDMSTQAWSERGDRESAFATFLSDVASADGLCVVVVEDLHWADEATLDLLRFVGRRIADSRTLVITTHRDETEDRGPALVRALSDLSHLQTSRRIGLQPLSVDGVVQLCAGREIDAADLHRLTGGNPFYVTELLAVTGTDLPPSISDSIRGRLVGLPDGVRLAAEAAAVMGHRIDVELWGEVVDVPPGTERQLVERGVLISDGSGTRFRHEITRVVIADDIASMQRTTWHRHILAALTAAGSDDHSQLSFHAAGAGDGPATLHHTRRAAEVAAAAGSMRDAAEHHQRAWDLAVDEPATVRASIADALAEARGLLDEYDAALAAQQSAIRLWAAAGNARREAASLVRCAWVRVAMGQVDQAFADCRRAVELLAPHGDTAELATTHAALARLHGLADDATSALDHVTVGQSIARALGLNQLLAELLNIEGCCLAMRGDDWQAPLDEAAERAEALGDQPLLARIWFNLHCMHVLDADFDASRRVYARALAHAERHQLHTYVVGLQRTHALELLQTGSWDDASDLAAKVIDEARADDNATAVEARIVLAMTAVRRGESSAPDHLDAAWLEGERGGSVQHLVPIRTARAEAAWLAGDLQEARKQVGLAQDLDVAQVHLRRDIALWAHRLGVDHEELHGSGPAALETRGHHARAAKAWEQRSCPYDAAVALLGSDAETDLRRAIEILDRLGAVATARVARKLMRDHGFTSVPAEARASTRAHPRGLTLREREVLDLVAEGLRNRDIAERLFLSPKTVAVHVSSIIAKLGVLNRGEAAAWARRHEEDGQG